MQLYEQNLTHARLEPIIYSDSQSLVLVGLNSQPPNHEAGIFTIEPSLLVLQ
jgi:hypothetical protein